MSRREGPTSHGLHHLRRDTERRGQRPETFPDPLRPQVSGQVEGNSGHGEADLRVKRVREFEEAVEERVLMLASEGV